MTVVNVLTRELVVELIDLARGSKRLRKNYNFHNLTDNVQRMLNAIEPDSYVRPHRHLNPPKVEMFILLKGKASVVIFDDQGEIMQCILLDGTNNKGVDVPVGAWHTIISLESGTVIFEVKDGPYIQADDKDFAKWAPEEGETGVQRYWNELKDKVLSY